MSPTRRTVRTRLAPDRSTRDPQAATVNRTWRGLDQPMVPEWSADDAFRYGVMANVVAFRCLQVWADTVASFPFRAGPTPPARPGMKADHQPTARLAQLLGPPTQRVGGRISGPNPEMTGRELIAWTVMQRIATGRNAWEIERAAGGQVAGLWPLPAAHLNPKPAPSGSGRYFDGYVVDGPGGKPIHLTVDEVFYGWTKGGLDVRQAQAPLQASRYAITLAVMSDRHNLAFLKNGAVPATIVTTEEFPSDEEREAFRRGWNDEYGGPDNAGKVKFNEVSDGDGAVGDTIDVKQLGIAQRDAQFAQNHLQSLKEVAWGLGVPWSKIDAADRTFSNAEAEERAWMLERVVPFLETLTDEINLRLAPMLGSEVGWFDLSGVEALRPKPRFTFAEAVEGVREGLLLPAEARDEFGLDPTVVVPGPVVSEVPVLPAPVEQPALPAGGVSDGQARDVQGHAAADALGDGGQPGPVAPPAALPVGAPASADGRVRVRGGQGAGDTRALTPEEQEQRRTRIWRRNDAALRGLEAAFAKRWAALFDRQAKVVVAQVTGKRTAARLTAAAAARELRADIPIGGPLDPAEIARWRRAAYDLADLMHTAATTAGVQRVNSAFGVSFDLEAPFVQDFIHARANQLAGQVTDTTYQAIQQALADGVAQGASIDDLAAGVQHVFDVASTSRARTIARTEVISASNGSASLAAAQLPADVAAGQEFIATRDERTRDDHTDADGQIVAMGQPFDVGGESLLYPGDPAGSPENVINCFPADTIIASEGIEGSYSRWYEGDMVRVTTRSGGILTGTPNHPVLTDGGWVGLGSLDVGDHLVRCSVGSLSAGSEPHVQRAPSPIGQVHDALTLASRAHRMAGADVDFHGDGREGDVDVVRTARLLQVGTHAASAEQRRQPNLAVADLLERAFGRARLPGELVGAGLAPTAGNVGGGRKTLALVGAGRVHPDLQRLASVARLHTGRQEATADGGASDAESGGEGQFTLPGLVAADQIINVERVPYAGHVFNLQTASGWYIANGIVTHNCRCTVAFLTPAEMGERARPRVVPLSVARLALRTLRAGDEFDAGEFRRQLLEVAA